MRFGLISRVPYTIELLRLTICLLFSINSFSAVAAFSWSDRSQGLRDLNVISVSASAPPNVVIYAVTQQHTYVSRDLAQTWRLIFALTKSNREAFDDEIPQPAREESFSRRDYDEDDLRRRGIVLEEENYDDIDDTELYRRLKDENLIEDPEEVDRYPSSETMTVSPGSHDRDSEWIVSVVVNPNHSDHVLILTNRSIHLSRDGGQSWTRLAINRSDIRAAAFGLGQDEILYATLQGLYQSDYSGGGFRLTSYSSASPYTWVKRAGARSDAVIAISERSIQKVYTDGTAIPVTLPLELIAEPLLAADWIDDQHLVAITERTVAICADSADWQLSPVLFLRGATLRDLVKWDDRLLLASDRGVFSIGVGLEETASLNQGLLDLGIRAIESIQVGERTYVIAATGSGIFLGGEGL